MRSLGVAICCLAAMTAVGTLAAEPRAQAPWLDGVWGNAAGCAYREGGSRDDDSLFVLTADGLESYATICDFVSVRPGKGAAVATALCGHEGEDVLTAALVIIRDPWDPESRTKRVTDADGNLWADVEPCD